MRPFTLSSAITCVTLAFCWSSQMALGADKPTFTGKYSVEQKNSNPGTPDSTIDLTQSSEAIDIVRVENSKKTTSHCPLHGSDGDYMSPGGLPGKCKAQLYAKYLIVESIVVARPQASAPPMRVHTKQRWQLSADGKTLAIKSSTDFPDVPAGISAIVASDTDSTVKYLRVVTP